MASQLLAITYKKGSTTLDTLSYTLNPRGHRTSRTQGTLTENYTYDPLGQLTAVASPTNTQTFAYDPLGNRTTVTATVPSPGTGAYTTNPLNQYTARDADTLSYDPNGNLAKITSPHPPHTATFTHNAKNRLIAATRGAATLHQRHDARNRVIRRQIGSDTRYLLYDGWNLIAEYAPNGALLAEYLHGPRIDEILCATSGTSTTYHHHDGLGSVIMLTNASGSVVERYRYDVFGHVTILDATHAPRAATAHNNRFLFTGREWLAALELYDYRNRSYSTILGRFLQTDPIRFAAGDVNLYRYVGNNPTNFRDPWGLWAFGWGDAWDYYNQLKDPSDGRFDGPNEDKLAHCMAHCEIVKQHPFNLGYLASYLLDIGKEAMDAIAGLWKEGSSWDDEDRKANQKGRDCASDPRGCECCCKDP